MRKNVKQRAAATENYSLLRASKKLARGDLFRRECTICLLAYGSPGGKWCKESLAAQGSEPTAQVAGLGTRVGGFIDSLSNGKLSIAHPGKDGIIDLIL
ncbi:MAG: hypothetical protein PUE14_02150, partial [Clostridia bacterium]|nr:hypothetical protein [Clostridia bacterium]